MAHELAHVVQGGKAVSRKEKKEAFYDERVVENFDEKSRTVQQFHAEKLFFILNDLKKQKRIAEFNGEKYFDVDEKTASEINALTASLSKESMELVTEELDAKYEGHSGELKRNDETLGSDFRLTSDNDKFVIDKRKHTLFNHGDEVYNEGETAKGGKTGNTQVLNFDPEAEKRGKDFSESRNKKVREYYKEKYKSNFKDGVVDEGMGPIDYVIPAAMLSKAILKGGFRFIFKNGSKSLAKMDDGMVRALSKNLEDYVDISQVAEKDAKEIVEKYYRTCDRDIDKITGLFSNGQGIVRTPEEIAILLKKGVKPPKVLARVSVKKYKSISHREMGWVLDPAEIQGLSNEAILKRIGWEQGEIQKILAIKATDRPSIVITLIEDPGNLKVPTWDIIQDETFKVINKKIINKPDKQFIESVKQIPGLYDEKRDAFNTEMIKSYFEALKSSPVEDVDKLPGDIQDFRDIIEELFGNNKLFTGKGFTVTPDGNFGLREWMMYKPDVGFSLDIMKQDGFIIKQIILKWE